MYTLPHVLQHFPKHIVVYEFVKGLFLFICCVIPEFFVHPYVGLHLAFLDELQRPLYLLEFHSKLEVKLQMSVMNKIVFLILQRQYQFGFTLF